MTTLNSKPSQEIIKPDVFELVKKIKQSYPNTKVIAISMYQGDQYFQNKLDEHF